MENDSAASSPLKYPPTSPATGNPGTDMNENSDPNRRAAFPSSTLGSDQVAMSQSQTPRRPNAPQRPSQLSRLAFGNIGTEVTSPLAYPSSSNNNMQSQSNRPLPAGASTMQPSQMSQLGSTPRRMRRNDVTSNSAVERALLEASQRSSVQLEGENNDETAATADGGAVRTLIWGTTVDPHEAMMKFKDFLLNFTLAHRIQYDLDNEIEVSMLNADLTDSERAPYYPRILAQRLNDGIHVINIDCGHIRAYPPAASLYNDLVRYPQEIVLHVMDFVVNSVFQDMFQDNAAVDIENIAFKVRPFNLETSTNLRDLNPEDIDKMVSVKGFVVRVSQPIPELKEGFYRCANCNSTATAVVEDGHIKEPDVCENPDCGQPSMEVVHSRCTFYNKQLIRLQEVPDSVPAGQTPHTVSLVAYDELVDATKPGDRVEITGIFKAMPMRVNPRQRITRSIFKTYVDVLHIKSTEKKRIGETVLGDLGNEESQIELQVNDKMDLVSPAAHEKIMELSRKPNLYEIMAASLAPSIYEQEDVKKAVLLQLFGGTNKTLQQSQSTKCRGNIHVLLCGDPAMSKSQILQYAHKLSPRGIYTSGKGSSAVGLTAYVTRDPETKQLVLESGALVLSDGGLCCIDEFDKMPDTTRSVLHEVMEQQTVSVAKAGIIATLNARTSILAAANPIHSKWNPKLPVVQNVNLPPSLLSRFDLVFLMLDKMDQRHDAMLAKHLVALYMSDEEWNRRKLTNIVDLETFAAYVSFARKTIHPVMDDESIEIVAEEYVQMRSLGSSSNTFTATARQLEAMIRLSEAHAKMRLSQVVERQDVQEAVRLIKEAMKLVAIDPKTGLLDMDAINVGKTAREREESANLKQQLQQLLLRKLNETGRGRVDSLHKSDLLEEFRQLTKAALLESEFDAALDEVLDDNRRVHMRNNIIMFERSR